MLWQKSLPFSNDNRAWRGAARYLVGIAELLKKAFQKGYKFLRGNLFTLQNMLSETKILSLIESGELEFPQLKFRLLKIDSRDKD